jgi:tetratricopeptide (TPR) repeat protein
MSDKHVEVVEKDALMQVESFWQKNQKLILGFAAVIILVVGGWYGYNEFIKKPNEEKAADIIYKSQQYFAMDSSHKVLDGDGSGKGVLFVIKNYGGTKSANLAHFYAGVSYLKLGDFNKAVEHLKDFSTDAKQIQMVAFGSLADAYSELNKKEEAIDYYKKAGSTFEKDQFSSAEFLFRAALLSETTGKTKEALELYKQIKTKFPNTDKGLQADKYIYRISVEKNDLSVN